MQAQFPNLPEMRSNLRGCSSKDPYVLRWNEEKCVWDKDDLKIESIGSQLEIDSIRVMTLNILKVTKEKLLFSQQRYAYILENIEKMMPHVAGFNQVTNPFNEMLLQCQWLKKHYWVSEFKPDQEQGMGNIIISRIRPIFSDSIEVSNLTRIIETIFLPIKISNSFRIVSISSVHYTAFAWKTSTRQNQMKGLMEHLNKYQKCVDGCILMGDMNFHSQEQNKLIKEHNLKDCWLQLNSLQENPGYTFDAQENRMINDIYWGFQKRRMRLDRILYKGKKLETRNIAIVLNEPIHGGKQQFTNYGILKGSFLFVHDLLGFRFGRQAKQKYLFPSDHFGLTATLGFNDNK